MGVYHAYSLMQHGGFWCDVFLVTPIAAYVAKNYQLAYLSWWSFLIFAAVVAFVMIAGYFYVKIGDAIPVPYAHDGKTPLAGWVHGIFAVAALWIIGMFYLTPIKPLPSVRDLIVISSLFTPFFFLGIYDFSRRWVFHRGAKIQFAVELAVLWIVTVVRIKYR